MTTSSGRSEDEVKELAKVLNLGKLYKLETGVQSTSIRLNFWAGGKPDIFHYRAQSFASLRTNKWKVQNISLTIFFITI